MLGQAITVAHRVDLEMICPYEPGRPAEEVRRALGLAHIIKLASNENPLGPSPRVIEALKGPDLDLHRYPDVDGSSLRVALATRLGVAPEQIVLGAGSADVMHLVAKAILHPGDETIVADVCFPVYETVTRLAGARPVQVPLDRELRFDLQRMLEAVTPRTRVVFIASPNSPTGHALPIADLSAFVGRLPPDVLCALDLAYWEYLEPSEAADPVHFVRQHPNVVLMRTFSKVYGLAGLRIGYAVASREVADWLGRMRLPFGTSTVAQAAAGAALDDQDHVARSVALNRSMRTLLTATAGGFGFRACPSRGNFVLLEGPGDSEAVFRHLLTRGIIVRPMRHPRVASCIRVTTGTEAETKEFIDAMYEFASPGA